MREAQFNSEVINSLQAMGFWAYKIADSPTSWTKAQTRFTPTKPSDIIACSPTGAMVMIEGKQFKSYKKLSGKNLRESQINALDAIVAINGRAYLFLNIRITHPRTNFLVAFNWKWHRERLMGEGISAAQLREQKWGTWVPGHKGLFDLSAWAEAESLLEIPALISRLGYEQAINPEDDAC